MADIEKVIKGLHYCTKLYLGCKECPYFGESDSKASCECKLKTDAFNLLKEQEAVVHPEPSCEMTYITDCCCDLCGVQLIREDNFCRCCGKPIVWEGR